MKAEYTVLLNRGRILRSRNISFGSKSLALICPECGKAAEYCSNKESEFPKYGILDDQAYDDYIERNEYFAVSSHALCPHCRKDFTVTGYLQMGKVTTAAGTYTLDEAKRNYQLHNSRFSLRDYDDLPHLICPDCGNAAPYQFVDWIGEAEDGYGDFRIYSDFWKILPDFGVNKLESDARCPCCGRVFDVTIDMPIEQFTTFKRHIKMQHFFLDEAESKLVSPERQERFSLGGFGGFSLPTSPSGSFSLPAPGTFSLSNARRCRP